MAGKRIEIGVLALQGGFDAHARKLEPLGLDVCEVRRVRRLESLDGLVIPGGESTTLLNLMRDEPWFDELRRFHDRGGWLLATCAGAILLSREVEHPAQPCLGLLDATIERNAYGRQVDSFETRIDLHGSAGSVPAVFIRAPIFRRLGPAVQIWARHDGYPVLVQQERILAATFHPELTDDDWVHRRFVQMTANRLNPGHGKPTPELMAG